MQSAAALRVRGLSAGYGGRNILKNIDVDIPAGSMTGIIGPNGAGKSTLLKAILGETVTAGRVEIFGEQLRDLRQIAYVPQRSGIDLDFPITALEVAVQGTYASLPWWRRPGRRERDWAISCLQEVGLAESAHRPLGTLSGGQIARVLIARALAQRPQVFLLDEPFAAVDRNSSEQILAVLRGQAAAGRAVAVVHHHLEQVPRYFSELIIIGGERIITGRVPDVFTPEILTQAFPDAHAIAQARPKGGEA